jgi:glycosyltransferase involved in cell wall biosynthesis
VAQLTKDTFHKSQGSTDLGVEPSVRTVSFFLPYFGDGGVERTSLILAREFVEYGANVDILTIKPWGPFLGQIPDGVRLFDLGTGRALTCLPRLASYMRRHRPELIISAQSYANLIAIWAHMLAGHPGELIVTERVSMSAATHYARSLRERLLPSLMRRFYPRADAIVANSQAGADDLAALLHLPSQQVHFIYNPTLHDEIFERAKEPLNDPWFQPGQPPVVLGVGRLTHQKDFHTLVRAFAAVRRDTEARLVILGEGEDRLSLEALASKLGVALDVRLAGFVKNPYKYMARAGVFALSSWYEGLPNVLIEALGLGTPVVSTDCPGGSREILLDGALGTLVPVEDAEALAREIAQILREGDAARRRIAQNRQHLERFQPKACLTRYLELAQHFEQQAINVV